VSIKVMGEVWDSSSAKGGARLVLLALADHANDEGYCHPSLARLAKKSALTERNVQFILRDLEARGELVVFRGAGRGRVSVYWVLPPDTVERLTGEGKTTKNFHPFVALEEKVKATTERVKTDAQKVKSATEKVKPTSPRTTKNRQEPSRTTTPEDEARTRENQSQLLETERSGFAGADAPDPGLETVVSDVQNTGTPGSVNAQRLERSSARGGAASQAWQTWLEAHASTPPDWLDVASWMRWLADLDERKSRVTSARLEEQLHRLEELSQRGEAQSGLIARAIGGGWETFYPERKASRDAASKPPEGDGRDDRYGRYR
jgi:Helix-turn-helix domain